MLGGRQGPGRCAQFDSIPTPSLAPGLAPTVLTSLADSLWAATEKGQSDMILAEQKKSAVGGGEKPDVAGEVGSWGSGWGWKNEALHRYLER